MPTKKIWIVSKSPWTAAPRDSWISLSKSFGEANYPAGELIDIILPIYFAGTSRTSYIDVVSNGVPVAVQIIQNPPDSSAQWNGFVNIWRQVEPDTSAQWNGFVNIWRQTCVNDFNFDFNVDFNCGSRDFAVTATWADFINIALQVEPDANAQWNGFINIWAQTRSRDFNDDFNDDFL